MEKPAITKAKNKFLKFLPKASKAAVSFQNPPQFSPRKQLDHLHNNKLRTHFNPMIPPDARRRSRNFGIAQEPTSPEISCMGQVKHHKNKDKLSKNFTMPKNLKPLSYSKPEKVPKSKPDVAELKKKPSVINKIFTVRRKSDASVNQVKPQLIDRAPSLSQMRKFASSRDTFANFNWNTTRVTQDSDEDCDIDIDDDDDVSIPFSAPISSFRVGLTLEPRKEINLWQRRTMDRPKPLELTG